MAKALIVNADDFGLTRGVNAGILQAHKKGIVTSTTLMVNMPGFQDAVALAGCHPKLATGLHLNLTYGRPLSPANTVSSLVDEGGRFVKDPSYVLGNGRLDEMMTEFGAQVRQFLSTGLTLSHIDTHHHLHRSAGVLDLVVEIAKELGVTIRCLDEQALREHGMVPKAQFSNFFGDRDGVWRLIDIINSLPEGVTEIPCHPGIVDDELRSASTLNEVRGRELAALTDPAVMDAVKTQVIRLTNYVQLWENGGLVGGNPS